MAILLAATLLSFSLPLAAQEEKPSFSLIPEPVNAQAGQGSFRLTKHSTIGIPANQAELRKIARYFNDKLAGLATIS